MLNLEFIVVAAGILGFGLVSRRLTGSPITPPMVFVAFGYLISERGLGFVPFDYEEGLIHTLAEITLVVVLFTDASRIDLRRLEMERAIPIRLLAIGMPLTIAAGALVAWWLLDLHFWEAALLAAVLAPTDAALGQAVVTSPRVPERLRQSLNVESGLNDGIALPLVLMLLSIACASAEVHTVEYWVRFALLQVTLGPLVGIAVGWLGGRLVDRATETGWMDPSFHRLSGLGLALLAFAGAELVHGNGFIAAFCAGAALGNSTRSLCQIEEFSETESQLLTLLVFLVFGGALVPETLPHLSPTTLLYGLLSLTLIRLVPVLLALLGVGLGNKEKLFLGWFGPRGIASILFALLIIEGVAQGEHDHLIHIVTCTVLLSILAHGLTAGPMAKTFPESSEERPEPLG
ncbi:MAG: cation:proton antiporter [Acidobacteriota bacterium]